MEALMTRPARRQRHLAGAVLTIALAALIGGLSSVPARADNDDHGRYEQERHARHHHHPVRHPYVRPAPGYVYAPPPVYYAPPPPPPAIDFVIPLHFR
jgi:hypothetical protein